MGTHVNIQISETAPTSADTVGAVWFKASTNVWSKCTVLAPLTWEALPASSGDMTKAVYDPNADGKIAETELALNYATHSNTLDHNGGTQDTAISGKEPANINIQAHVISAHAPSNAQKNSDILKSEIEAVLTGQISSHTHAGGGSLPTPVNLTLFAGVALKAWTNMPAAETDLFGIANLYYSKVDLTNATQSRIVVRIAVAPVVNAKIKVKYSTDGSTWYDLCSVTMPATANNTNVGVWTNIPAGAKADVFIKVVGIDGNGTADPSFGLITLQVK